MVLQVAPVLAAIREVSGRQEGTRTLILGPRGRVTRSVLGRGTGCKSHAYCWCAVGTRVSTNAFSRSAVLEEVSVGDYILGGGEVAAMALIEVVSRLVPGVVGDPESVSCRQLRRGTSRLTPAIPAPPRSRASSVPEVLLSGNHEVIRRWRLERSVEMTVTRRPDLVKRNWERYSKRFGRSSVASRRIWFQSRAATEGGLRTTREMMKRTDRFLGVVDHLRGRPGRRAGLRYRSGVQGAVASRPGPVGCWR